MLQLNYKLTDEDYIEFNEFHQLIHSEIGKRNLFFLRLIGPMISILAMIIFILARAEVMLIIGEAIIIPKRVLDQDKEKKLRQILSKK